MTIRSTAARVVLAAALGLGVLTGCGGEGTDVSCNLDNCTVTMDRGVNAQASVLGVDVKLVGVAAGQVTLDVEGNQVTVPTGGTGGTEVAGLSITVQEVTDDKVVLQISRAG